VQLVQVALAGVCGHAAHDLAGLRQPNLAHRLRSSRPNGGKAGREGAGCLQGVQRQQSWV
jgi:hypothetical protein